jgi:hypothetical protein
MLRAMTPGTIYAAARRQHALMVRWSFILTVCCVGVIAAHYQYLRGWIRGPVAFDARDRDGSEFVRLEGELAPTGVVESTGTRVLHVVTVHEENTAEYVSLAVGDKQLVVKVPPGFSGNAAEGRLVEIPYDLMRALGANPARYPFFIDASKRYRTDLGWPLIIALLLFLPMLLWLVSSLRDARSAENHAHIAKLARFGKTTEVAERIERELDESTRADCWWISASWMVEADSLLFIYPAEDLAGVAWKTTTKEKSITHRILVWEASSKLVRTFTCKEPAARLVVERIGSAMPWAFVHDPDEFEKAWARGPAAALKATQARRA